MVHQFRFERVALAATVTVFMFGSFWAMAAGAEQEMNSQGTPPAGQRCPDGHYVIGFDRSSNIICSGECGNAVLDAGESCDDGNTVAGDSCSATCQSEGVEPVIAVTEQVEQAPAPEVAISADLPGLEITDIEPSTLVFGKSGVTVSVIGTGFDETSVVLFEGDTYEPVVNPAGTRLSFNPATAELSIGAYAITVLNESGQKVTRKRSLVVF